MTEAELPPSIIVDDNGTKRDAMLVDVRAGMATYKTVGPPQPVAFSCPRGYGECEDARTCVYPGRCGARATRLEADTARAMDLIGKALGS